VTFEHVDDGKNGVFYAVDGEDRLGKITYVWLDAQKILIDHTIVDPAHGGKGVGGALLDKAVSFAREKELKIVPQCSFVVKKFASSDAFDDVKA
jgi:predicted GNAT family acetyltransferase